MSGGSSESAEPAAEPAPDADPKAVQILEGQLRIPVEDDDSGGDSDAVLSEPPPASGDEPPQIRRVWLRSFKGFEDFSVSLGAFNVLAGANNSGKSTLLQGIDLLFALLKLHTNPDSETLAETGRLVPARILPVASVKDLYSGQVWRRANTYVDATVGAEFADGSLVEFGIRYLFGGANSRVLSASGMSGSRLKSLLAKPAVWVPSGVGIVIEEEFRTPARRAALISEGRQHEVLRNLLMELNQSDRERFEKLQQILQDRFGARVGELEFDQLRDQFVSADYASEGVHHDLYSAGAGFVQVAQLLTFVLGRRSGVVLLDEPDAHLHSSLQRVVVEILDEVSRDEGFQVLIATHSKEIINFVDPTRLILIESGASRAEPVSDEVTPMTVLRSVGAIDNVDAYALVKNRRCLFVEGVGDLTILGRFAAPLGIRALTGDDRVVAVPVGGADRFEHVQQLNVFEGMINAPIASLELRDRDGMTDDHRDRIIDAAARPLLVWERDSIESYLLDPAVIARVINDIASERGLETQATEAEVVQLIEDACEELKEETQDRLSQRFADDRFRLDAERVSIPSANEAARAVLDVVWADAAQRLTVVSGKRLLSAVRKAIQDRFSVNFGNERLAEAFTADEIPEEVSGALRDVSALEAPAPAA